MTVGWRVWVFHLVMAWVAVQAAWNLAAVCTILLFKLF